MLYTEHSVRDNVRNREGRRVFYLGEGDRLTPGARDWLREQKIEILEAAQAKKERHALLGGGYVEEKPEHMTHLNGDVLVSKLHPRIAFRGAVDTLEAELILAQLNCEEPIRGKLGQVLALTRKIIRCDVLEEPMEDERLCGLTEAEIREMSHFPQKYYDQPHFMSEAADGAAIARINRARCAAREAELRALAAFCDREGNPTRTDILRTMNRLSSMLYLLMIELKAKR